MRIPFIAGNWKMFKTVHEAVAFVKEFRSAREGRRTTSRSSSRRRSRRSHAVGRGGAQLATSASRRRTCTGSARARSPARSARR